MRIGFIGLGKLGFPCSVGVALSGHEVYGYDSDPRIIEGYRQGLVTPFEPGLEDQYASCRERMHYCDTLDEAVANAEVIFVAVPTPHAPTHDGSLPYDGKPLDFDTLAIRECLEDVGRAIANHAGDGVMRTILVISTVTPGTMRENLVPAIERAAGQPIGDGWTIVYNPFFIGQSTVVRDFLHPEFVLLGCPPGGIDRGEGERIARELYSTLHTQPICPMTWTEAECVKLCYNTYLGLKVVFANTVMELCHKLPDARCDVVNSTLKLATDRLISPKYMDGGMADGGPCHGRDQMAMSYIAHKVGLSFNIFDTINEARDTQTGWLADLVIEHRRGRPVVLLGMAFKPDTNQTQGSPALLLANILRDKGVEPIIHDPVLAPEVKLSTEPALYVISTCWSEYRTFPFRAGDTVLDPWRMIDESSTSAEVIAIGAPRLPLTVKIPRAVRPVAAAG